MVRVKNREERDDWITCLNNAAQLRVEDLWEFDTEFEFGQGRFASVYPARRKTHKYFESGGGHEAPSIGEGNPDRASLLKRCDCAIKVVDKNQFWRRVVKGRERSDTLVREPSVQSTLTAKCGRVPTFLQLRGFFETSDSIVMELELLEGTDLFEYVSSKGVLGEDEAALIAKDILTSLDAMNRVGLAHRDIKPANILMCRREKDGVSVKVGDFGMSTFVGVDGLVRGRCGTPGYVAPEILTAASLVGYGNKVDIFSAGVTLYVMLCGYEPFYGENEKELIEANKRGVIDFPESDWGEVSKEARDLVLKMTAANPLDRVNAKEALQHPWITRLESEESESSAQSNIKTIALNAYDSPEEGGCVIS
jgi:serine/threonine protein kinase